MELSVELGVGFYWVRDLVRVSFFFSSDSRAEFEISILSKVLRLEFWGLPSPVWGPRSARLADC